MALRTFRCAVEQIADWHSHLFVEPHVVAFIAVASKYSDSPARFDVRCDNITSRRLGKATQCSLEVSWHPDSAEKASRMRATTQTGPILELAAIAVGLILVHRVVPLGLLDVTAYGERADYRFRKRRLVLEVSGTETGDELARRHREKTAQALSNPFGWDACVAVCAFSRDGHQVIFSRHSAEEGEGAKSEE
jgi:hypothetical protein